MTGFQRRRPTSEHDGSRVTPAAGLLLGALGAAAAWFLLVRLAIGFGNQAQDGDAVGWGYLALAVLGATALLLVAVALVQQLLVAVGVVRGYQPKRARRH